MTTFVFANNAFSTLSGAITNTSTTINLAAGGGALFPNPSSGQQFAATLIDAATGLIREIVYCTNRATDVLTVVRAQEGTTPLNWNPGDLCQHLLTAGQMAAMEQQSGTPASGIYSGTDTGSVNAMVASVTPTPVSLVTFMLFEITPRFANTSSTVTFTPSGLGPANVFRADGTNLLVGDIQAAPYKALMAYDATATKFLLLNPCLWDSQFTNFYTGVDTGSADHVRISITEPPITAYAAGMVFSAKIAAANATTTPDFEVGSLGVVSIIRADGSAIAANDLKAGDYQLLTYTSAGNVQLTGVTSDTSPPITTEFFDTAGTFTFNVPAWCSVLRDFEAWGGGGGGGGSLGTGSGSSSSGGGGGGYTFASVVPVVPGSTITYTVGDGGLGGTGNATGSTGVTTIFGAPTPIGATGGTGGSPNGTNIPGIGGSGFGGQVNLSGQQAGISSNTGTYAVSGSGGSSPFGGGIPTWGVINNGAAGLFPGGGASGGSVLSTGSASGGKGSVGAITFKV